MASTIEVHTNNYGELRTWGECVNRTLINLDFRSGVSAFSGAYHYLSSGTYVAARLFGTAHRTTRSHQKVRTGDNDFVLLIYNRSGSASVTHRRYDGPVQSGSFFALDASKPHVLDMSESFDHLVIRMPTAHFVSLHPAISLLLDKPISAQSPELVAAASIIDIAVSLGAVPSGTLGTIADTAVKLLGEWIASDEVSDLDRNLHHALLKRRILKGIDEQFADPTFSAASLADLVGVSRRYIDMILASTNTTFGKAVLERRLDLCYRILMNSKYDGKSITAIALDSGFNDLSHFSKRFRERFGMSPRMARNARNRTLTEH
ncbi:helix-turn-helix domain-containing protein [Paraburkholderia mimosarum]|uniref:helix-turn-helix domain-containing protein n=1 Tax=Paraburkholderia mimosarum TaxID=312026 RepID=UPI000487BE15|nr:helix-turn-helix domain-containing protein [Paraburkholderia mimosarum]